MSDESKGTIGEQERIDARERLYAEILYMSDEAKKEGITFSEYVRINGWKAIPVSNEIIGSKKIQSMTNGNIMKLFGKELNPIIIKTTLILLFISTLFPPKIDRYDHVRIWDFLFNESSRKIDILTLLVEYVLIFFLMGIVHLFMKDKGKNKSQ